MLLADQRLIEMPRAVAQLFRARTFTLTACVSLALAVGANSAIFSIVNALWLRPLPVRDPARVVVPYYPVVHSTDGELLDEVRFPAAEQLHLLSSFERVTFEVNTASRIGDWRPIVRLKPGMEDVRATAVSQNYFEALGVPIRGRPFTLEDDRVGAPPVAVVSDRFWRRVIPGALVGAVLDTTRGPITVVGIARPGFNGPRIGDQVDLWMPFGSHGVFSELGSEPRMRALTPVVVFARLRRDVSIEAAETEVRNTLDHRTTLRSLREVAFPLRSEGALVRQDSLLKTLWLAAILVLVLGAANLAALLMARAAAQRHHWAIRLSVGSSRQALVRSVISEVLVLAAAGLAIGLVFRLWLVKSIMALEPAAGVPIAHLDVSLDWRVIIFAAAIVLVSVGLASVGAARQAARADLSVLLAAGSSTTTTTALGRQVLLAAHVCLSVTLLVAALGLVGSVRHAMRVDLGFARHQVIFARVRPAIIQYMREQDDAPRRIRDYAEALNRLGALPDVSDVSYGARPLDTQPRGDSITAVTVDGIRRQIPMVRLDAGAGYLRAIGAVFVEGRDLSESDAEAAVTRTEMMRYVTMRRFGRESGPMPKGGRSAAVIDAALASVLWPGESAVGRSFRWESLQITYEVVGVVRDLGQGLRREAPLPTLVAPVALRTLDGMHAYDVIVRTGGNSERAAPLVTGVLRELFPDAPQLEVRTARHILEARMAQERMGARIFSWYAIAAALLGLAGVYGLLAFFAAETRRDLAIRAALGATGTTLVRIAAVRVLAPVTVGVFAGLLLSGWLRALLGSTVIGLSDASALAEASAAAIFLSACVIVTAFSTRKLRHMSPAEVLHQA